MPPFVLRLEPSILTMIYEVHILYTTYYLCTCISQALYSISYIKLISPWRLIRHLHVNITTHPLYSTKDHWTIVRILCHALHEEAWQASGQWGARRSDCLEMLLICTLAHISAILSYVSARREERGTNTFMRSNCCFLFNLWLTYVGRPRGVTLQGLGNSHEDYCRFDWSIQGFIDLDSGATHVISVQHEPKQERPTSSPWPSSPFLIIFATIDIIRPQRYHRRCAFVQMLLLHNHQKTTFVTLLYATRCLLS